MKLKELQHWLTPTDAGRLLDISRQAVHKRLEEGKMGRAVKTRAGWLIDPTAVEEAMLERWDHTKLEKLRKDAGIPYTELVDRSGVAEHVIRRLEAGEVVADHPKCMGLLAHALNVRPYALMRTGEKHAR